MTRHTLILGSGSPRRKELLRGLGLDFTVRVSPVDEHFPKGLNGREIALFLAELKAEAQALEEGELLLTADTIVWHNNRALGKAANEAEALEMLRGLNGHWHEVYTGCCLRSREKKVLFSSTTRVKFREMPEEELQHYVSGFRPYDKAGAYGIQEWIGLAGVESIEGSYFNVVGLPVHQVWVELQRFGG